MKKGMELPVNTLVIMVIALVVLIAFIALFMNIQGQGGSSISIETAKNSGCQKFVSMGYCNTPKTATTVNIQAVKCSASSQPTTLEALAINCYSLTDTSAVANGATASWKLCGCT